MKQILGRWPVLVALLLVACDQTRVAGGVDDHENAVARIQVVDSLGEPVPASAVVVHASDWLPGDPADSSGESPDYVHTTTDSTGYVTVHRLRPGRYSVVAGWGNIAGRTFVDAIDTVSLVVGIYPTGGIRGKLVGAPPGTWVAVRGLEGVTVIDSVGDYVVPFVPIGTADVVAGLDRRSLEMHEVPILDRKVSRVADQVFRMESPRSIRPVIQLSTEPLPPVFLSPQGTYTSFLKVQILAPILGNSLEVSVQGGQWTAMSGMVGLGGSACLQARSIQSSNVRSDPSQACYSIQAQ